MREEHAGLIPVDVVVAVVVAAAAVAAAAVVVVVVVVADVDVGGTGSTTRPIEGCFLVGAACSGQNVARHHRLHC